MTLAITEYEAFNVAKKYSRRVDFWKAETSIYMWLQGRGFLDKATKHMPPRRGCKDYHDKRLKVALDAAKSHKTVTDFKLKDRNNWQYLYRRPEHYKDAVRHMDRVGSRYKRLVYAILSDKLGMCYIGLTYNFDKRMRSHKALIQKSTADIVQQDDCRMITLTDYMNVKDAQFFENYYAEFALTKFGYIVTNAIETGGLGGNVIKWDKASVFQAAVECKTKGLLLFKYPGALARSKEEGYFQELSKEMKW